MTITAEEYQVIRKTVLTQICAARIQSFRLQRELAEIGHTLPENCYITRYKSNSKRNPQLPDNSKPGFWYYALGCTQKKLPSAKPEKSDTLTKKLHLGHVENPNFLTAVMELERSKIHAAKEKALVDVRSHLKHLQAAWLWYKRAIVEDDTDLRLFYSAIKSKNIFEFIKSKNLATI